jgi:hypothetical protein
VRKLTTRERTLLRFLLILGISAAMGGLIKLCDVFVPHWRPWSAYVISFVSPALVLWIVGRLPALSRE